MNDFLDQRDEQIAELIDAVRAELRDSHCDGTTSRQRLAASGADDLFAVVCDLEAAVQDWKACPPAPTDEFVGPLPCDLPGGRFTLLQEIARGGMGAVFRAMDNDLQRRLAVKVMRLSPGGRAEQRFLEEARITGQLQHPGVAPVHEVGNLIDGRPFFAMKLIEGDTLAHMLESRAAPHTDLPRFLTIFASLAQTLAYAHAQGFIHRDLKPANIMVGAFGEVQVMDWGLAKRLHAASKEVIEEDATSTAWHSNQTLAGTVLGTVAFMAPEQAQGKVNELDERCDVFGLGAILCVILTGRPPYGHAEDPAVRRRAECAELADALTLLDACGADSELVTLARECLAPLPEQRPRDAGVVAQRMSAYLSSVQDRLKAAEIQQAAERTRAIEERKRRRFKIALAVCALLLLLGVVAAFGRHYVAQIEVEARRAQVEHDVSSIVTGVQESLTGLDAQHADAIKHRALLNETLRWQGTLALAQADLRRAKDLLDGAPEGVAAALAQRVNDLQMATKAAEENRLLAARLDDMRVDQSSSGKWNTAAYKKLYPELFHLAGFDILGADVESLTPRLRGAPLRWSLIAALDHWAAHADRSDRALVERLLRLARGADPDPWRDRFRQVEVWEKPELLTKLADDAETLNQSPQFIELLAQLHYRHGADPLPLLHRALLRHPRDALLFYYLGFFTPDPRERAAHYRTAIAIRPSFSLAHVSLGFALEEQGKLEDALTCYLKAVEAGPTNAIAHSNTAIILVRQKRDDDAIGYLKKAIELDPAFAAPHINLGQIYARKGKAGEALAFFQKALEADPNSADAHVGAGALHESKDLPRAIEHYRKATQANPKHALAHANLGGALVQQGKPEEGEAVTRKAIALDPNYPIAHYNLGLILLGKKNAAQALESFSKAIEIDGRYVDAHYNRALALEDLGDSDKAFEALHRLVELDPTYGRAHAKIGIMLHHQGKSKEALAAMEKAVATRPDDWGVWYYHGIILESNGRAAEALKAYQRTVELNPQWGDSHRKLGLALKRAGRFGEAVPALQRGQELILKNNTDAKKLVTQFFEALQRDDEVRDCQRLLKAEGQLAAYLRSGTQPESAAELLALADLCREYQKRYALAVRFYTEAFSRDKQLAQAPARGCYHAACAAALAGTGQGIDVDESRSAEFRKQALSWLHAELADGSGAKTNLDLIATANDFAALRDPAQLAKLPATERDAWMQFWADVAKRRGKPAP